jgi:hypothetical protein
MTWLDSREKFDKSFLIESLEKTGPRNDFSFLLTLINEKKQYFPNSVTKVKDNWIKYQSKEILLFWYEDNNEIYIAAEFSIDPYILTVNIIGKNLKFKKSYPYASDLYSEVLEDSKSNNPAIKLYSDKSLSEEGFKIWQRLLDKGHKISVYDVSDKNHIELQKITNIDDLKKYHMQDPEFQKYRYVISETSYTSDLNHFFVLREYRRLSGIL